MTTSTSIWTYTQFIEHLDREYPRLPFIKQVYAFDSAIISIFSQNLITANIDQINWLYHTGYLCLQEYIGQYPEIVLALSGNTVEVNKKPRSLLAAISICSLIPLLDKDITINRQWASDYLNDYRPLLLSIINTHL